MKSEKQQLVGFSLFIMREFGMGKYLSEHSMEQWLKFPISGARQAASDMVEATKDINGEELQNLDAMLNKQNLPTLTNMRQNGFKQLLKILSGGKIKNEEGWRLLRSFLENDSLSDTEALKIQELLDEYEFTGT